MDQSVHGLRFQLLKKPKSELEWFKMFLKSWTRKSEISLLLIIIIDRSQNLDPTDGARRIL